MQKREPKRILDLNFIINLYTTKNKDKYFLNKKMRLNMIIFSKFFQFLIIEIYIPKIINLINFYFINKKFPQP